MSKHIACTDVVDGCTYKATAPNEEELLKQVTAHAVAEHGVKEVTPELAARVPGEGGDPRPLESRGVPVPAAEPADETLVARATGGDDSAFEALVLRYSARVFRLACRLTGSEADAPDVAQETFIQVHRNLRSFRGEARFSTWLYRIATNAALMQRRARTRRPTDSLEEYLPAFDGEGVHTASAAEVAALLELTPATVRQRVHRACLMLRGFLGHVAREGHPRRFRSPAPRAWSG